MRISEFSRSALGLCAAVVLLAGCGGTVPQTAGLPFAPAGSIPEWQAKHEAHAACTARPGEAMCLALILDGNLQREASGWAPADFQARYKLPSKSKGAGQIVAIVDAYDNPNVASDLANYRKNFGLGTATFAKYNQRGQKKNYPKRNPAWALEEDLDVEMVSATCPKCTIYLVEADAPGEGSLDAAEDEAVKLGAHIVSNSWICYGSVTCVNASSFSKPGVMYLAAAGDRGFDQFGAPMAFDSVAAIGGTVLSKSGSHYGESGWSGSGGGCVTDIQKPKWQHDKLCWGRLTNDASAVAWGVAEYDSYGGYGGWFTVGGTSVSSPLLAGVFGLAGNATKQDGGRTFWQDANEQYLYDLCRSTCLFDQYAYAIGWGSPHGIGAF
jgi:subtilase family serine protease